MWERVQLHWRAQTPPGRGPAPEWLVTNGIGGFASGTTFGYHTRRYHGWLVAALQPPVRRTLLWAKGEERLEADGRVWPLSVNDYGDTFHPDGWMHIRSFRAYPFPATVFCAGGIVLERTIFMVRGQNTTAVVYRLAAGPPGAVLVLQPLINCRDYHHTVRANDWPFRQRPWECGAEIVAYPGAPPLILGAGGFGEGSRSGGTYRTDAAGRPGGSSGTGGAPRYRPDGAWFYRFHYAAERERGLDFVEDHFCPGEFRWTLRGPGDVAVVVGHCPWPGAGLEPPWRDGPAALAAWTLERLAEATTRRERLVRLAAEVRRARAAHDEDAEDPDRARLVLAADDFVVRRASTGAATVIAGYPWFTDWGRDAMISLPGLLLETGRFEEAREVLLTFAEHRSGGLVPNRFPDDGGEPVYNAADASLWWVYAAWLYWRATRDGLAKTDLFPVMLDIVESYMRGTRHGIGADADGLVAAADPGLQLTWMDAKAGDWVVTPRAGAPVEVNALWYNALRTVEQLSRLWAPSGAGRWAAAADAVGRAFRRRFEGPAGSLFDVVPPEGSGSAGSSFDVGPSAGAGPAGRPDEAFRPNQLFAAALPFPVLSGAEAQPMVRRAAAELLTPVGLRTLSPSDPAYRGRYGGDQRQRDGAYHQGTVWPWLLGPFVDAARRAAPELAVWPDALRAHLRGEAALGHVSEIFDGDPPHGPRGCFAQAWSVAEWLRVGPAPGTSVGRPHRP